ncbi:MAG: NifU family protein [Chloroflexi bacterium]|nr:NifU family protein [Chloroflexota bacterium]
MENHTHEVASDLERMRTLIGNVSAYIEQFHSGSVELVSFDGRKLQVRLGGACDGCSLSTTTLKGWVGGTVKQFFPDVEVIEAVD